MICPKCGSWKIVYIYSGFNGKSYYRCNECGKTFYKESEEHK